MSTHFSANPDPGPADIGLDWAGSSGELTRNSGQRTTSPVSILSTFSALCEDQSSDLETDDMNQILVTVTLMRPLETRHLCYRQCDSAGLQCQLVTRHAASRDRGQLRAACNCRLYPDTALTVCGDILTTTLGQLQLQNMYTMYRV